MSDAKNIEYRRHKSYQELTFTDDFMFRKVLRNNEKLCKDLVELLLDVRIDHIVYKDDDHSVTPSSENKGIRLDVYLKDENGRVFDLEMQNTSSEHLPKRVRYYQGVIDIDNMLAGYKYRELPDSYIVFICTFKPFERDLPKYEFRELCTEDKSIELETGTAKVFINARSESPGISAELRSFFNYLCGAKADSDFTKVIEEDISKAKAIRPWEMEYMTLYDKLIDERDEGRAEGLKEGRAKGLKEGRAEAKLEAVDRLVSKKILKAAEACEVLGVPLEDYNAYRLKLKES